MVQNSTSLIGIIGVILGVILGFLLNILKEWYNNRNQTQSIKRLIFYEIIHNKKLIKDFVKEIDENSKEKGIEKQYAIKNIPLPPLNNGMYTKYTLFLTNSIPEFEKIYEFYRNLDDLKFKYDKMILILTRDHSITFHWHGHKPDQVIPRSMPESDEILLSELCKELEDIIHKLLLNTQIKI